ncbi:MAG: MarR family transcriptional regulator [Sphingobium sp.]
MENNLAFLCVDIARLFRKQFADAAREFSGTGAQWRALMIINRFPGINQGALSECLDVEPITTCRLVDRMEQAGLVERKRDVQDRRVWQLFLTDAAMPTIEAMEQAGKTVLQKGTGGMTAEDLITLDQLLNQLRSNLSDVDLTQKDIAHG